jgi:hypothetical protein
MDSHTFRSIIILVCSNIEGEYGGLLTGVLWIPPLSQRGTELVAVAAYRAGNTASVVLCRGQHDLINNEDRENP